MNQFKAVQRGALFNGQRIYDLPHVWPDGVALHGLVYSSWLIIRIADLGPAVDPHASHVLRRWVPGEGSGIEFNLAWGEEFAMPLPAYGMVSVVTADDVPLHVLWELTAGVPTP